LVVCGLSVGSFVRPGGLRERRRLAHPNARELAAFVPLCEALGLDVEATRGALIRVSRTTAPEHAPRRT
jgi:hypothetical protein